MTRSTRNFWMHGVLLAFALFSFNPASACNFSSSNFSSLDYGLYWYGQGNNCQKAIPGQANPYYNKNNKVIIYIHGWQKDSVTQLKRETFDVTANGGPSEILSDYWLSRGYNVGVMYWNQFADESEVKDAEAKIWSTAGPRAMRWKNSSGVYSTGPTKHVTQLLYEAYRDNLAGYTGGYIRIAGHSLGNQIAVNLTNTIYTQAAAGAISANLKPKRVALLDPFYSNNAKSYLGNKWTGEVARTYVSSLKTQGVIFEAYRSSAVTSTIFVGDDNKGLMNMTAFTELKPEYFGTTQQAEKHIAARWHYFWSINFNTPTIKNSSDAGLSAATTDARTTTLMNGTQRLIHELGTNTQSPSDDRFIYGSRL